MHITESPVAIAPVATVRSRTTWTGRIGEAVRDIRRTKAMPTAAAVTNAPMTSTDVHGYEPPPQSRREEERGRRHDEQ